MLEPLFQKCCRPQVYMFIKKEAAPQVFPVNFAKFFKAPFFTEHLWLIKAVMRNSVKLAEYHLR